MIKKIAILVGLLTVMAMSVYASFDGTITLANDTSQYAYGNGGEFKAVTSGLGTFQTFCMEHNEEFYPGVTYNYRINTGTVSGGVGSHEVDPFTGKSMDNISIGTAWLYSQFRAETLTGYNYTYGSDRTLSANALQQAIWWLEDEGGTKNSYVTIAESILHLNDTTIKGDSEGAFGVVALNLYDRNSGVNAQDQLAIVPEPTAMMAGILLLLPFCASTLRIGKR